MFAFYGINNLILEYVRWHYGRGVRELFTLAHNILRFIAHFFSVGLLLQTLFHPLQRMQENYSKGLDLGAFFSSLLVNTIMRLVGFVARTCIIVFCLIAYLLAFPIILLAVVSWLLAPLLLLLFVISSVSLITQSL